MERAQLQAAVDEHFRAVGEATTAYGMMEDGLSSLFLRLLDAPIEQVRAIWNGSGGLERRLKITRSLAEASLEGEILDRTKALLSEVKKKADLRAQIAHGQVQARGVVSEEGGQNREIMFSSGLKLEEILKEAAEFRSLNWQLGAISSEISALKKQKPVG